MRKAPGVYTKFLLDLGKKNYSMLDQVGVIKLLQTRVNKLLNVCDWVKTCACLFEKKILEKVVWWSVANDFKFSLRVKMLQVKMNMPDLTLKKSDILLLGICFWLIVNSKEKMVTS